MVPLLYTVPRAYILPGTNFRKFDMTVLVS